MPSIKIRRVDFYPADWLEGALSLTHEERSIYITVCACIYSRGGPVEISHLRKFCPGHGFKRAFDGLLRKGKITRNERGEVDQRRCAAELARAERRNENGLKTDSNRTERGPSADRARTEQRREPFKTTGLQAPRAGTRALVQQASHIESLTSSSSLPSSARAPELSVGLDRAHDTEALTHVNGAMRSIGAQMPPVFADTPENTHAARSQMHMRYLQAQRPGELSLYLEAQCSDDPIDGQRMFDLVEAEMTRDGWDEQPHP